MLTDFQKQVVLFTKERYAGYPEITLESFAAYYYDLRIDQVRVEHVVNLLFPIFDVMLPEADRLEMLYGMFKKNRENNGSGESITMEDITAYLKGKMMTYSFKESRVCNVDLGDVDEMLVRELVKLSKYARFTLYGDV